jgi:hypothetical protein
LKKPNVELDDDLEDTSDDIDIASLRRQVDEDALIGAAMYASTVKRPWDGMGVQSTVRGQTYIKCIPIIPRPKAPA